MQPKAYDHVGELADPETRRAGDMRDAEANKIISHSLLALTENGEFLLWFQRYAYPAMTQDFPVNNGSTLAHFMGKRQLIISIIKEMDKVSPGFLSRLLAARDSYEKMLLAAEQPREK